MQCAGASSVRKATSGHASGYACLFPREQQAMATYGTVCPCPAGRLQWSHPGSSGKG
jgi:hypothetical protein